MKLHLPSGLRKALLACLAAVALPAATIPTTIASASGIAAVFLIASQRAWADFSGPSDVQEYTKASDQQFGADSSVEVDCTTAEGVQDSYWTNKLPKSGDELDLDQLNLKINFSGIADTTEIKLGGGSGASNTKFDGLKSLWLTGQGIVQDTGAFGTRGPKEVYINGVQLNFGVWNGNDKGYSALETDFIIGAGTCSKTFPDRVQNGKQGHPNAAQNAVLKVGDDTSSVWVKTSGKLTLQENARVTTFGADCGFQFKGGVTGAYTLTVSTISDSGDSGRVVFGETGGTDHTSSLTGLDVKTDAKVELQNGTLTLTTGLTLGKNSQFILTGGTLTAGAITVDSGNSSVIEIYNGNSAKLDFSEITGGKLTINLSGFSAGEFDIFGDTQFSTWLSSHKEDWSESLTFTGVSDGFTASLITDEGGKNGWLSIKSDNQPDDFTNIVYDRIATNTGGASVEGNTNIDINSALAAITISTPESVNLRLNGTGSNGSESANATEVKLDSSGLLEGLLSLYLTGNAEFQESGSFGDKGPKTIYIKGAQLNFGPWNDNENNVDNLESDFVIGASGVHRYNQKHFTGLSMTALSFNKSVTTTGNLTLMEDSGISFLQDGTAVGSFSIGSLKAENYSLSVTGDTSGSQLKDGTRTFTITKGGKAKSITVATGLVLSLTTGETLELGEGGTISGTLNGDGNAGLKVSSGTLEVATLSGKFKDLTLGATSTLNVKSGNLELTGALSFETESKIKLNANGQQITLTETALQGIEGKVLSIVLTSDFMGDGASNTIKLFTHWNEDWDKFFTFSVADDSVGTYKNLHVDGGNLVWGEIDQDWTWDMGAGTWSSASFDGKEQESANHDITFSATGATSNVDITVSGAVSAQNITVSDGAKYTFQGGTSITATGTLDIGTGAEVKVDMNMTVVGKTTLAGKLTLGQHQYTFTEEISGGTTGELKAIGREGDVATCIITLNKGGELKSMDLGWGVTLNLGADLILHDWLFNRDDNENKFLKIANVSTGGPVNLVLDFTSDKEISWHRHDLGNGKGSLQFDNVGLEKKGSNNLTLKEYEESSVGTHWKIQNLKVTAGALKIDDSEFTVVDKLSGASSASLELLEGAGLILTGGTDATGFQGTITMGNNTSIALGSGAKMKAGTLALGTSTGTIKLTVGNNFDGGFLDITALTIDGTGELKIVLTDWSDEWVSQHADGLTLFTGGYSAWLSSIKDRITFWGGADGANDLKDQVQLDENGKLIWEKAPTPLSDDLYWGGGDGETGNLTWGGDEGVQFGTTEEGGESKDWSNGQNVHFVDSDGGEPHTVTLGANIQTKDMSIGGGVATWNFVPTGTETLTVGGDLMVSDGATATFTTNVTVSGALTLAGSGTAAEFSTGTVSFGSVTGVGNLTLGNGGTVTGAMNGTDTGLTVTLGGDLTVGSMTGTLSFSAKGPEEETTYWVKSEGTDLDATKVTFGAGTGLGKTGTGELTLTGDNTETPWEGGLKVSGGKASLGNAANLAINGDVTVEQDALLEVKGTGKSLTVGGNFKFVGGELDENYNNTKGLNLDGSASLTVEGEFSGSGKLGVYGTLTLKKGGTLAGVLRSGWGANIALGADLIVDDMENGGGSGRTFSRSEDASASTVYILRKIDAGQEAVEGSDFMQNFKTGAEYGENVGYGITGNGTLTFTEETTIAESFKIAGGTVKLDGDSTHQGLNFTFEKQIVGDGSLLVVNAATTADAESDEDGSHWVNLKGGADMRGELTMSLYGAKVALGANAKFGGLTTDGDNTAYDRGRTIKKSADTQDAVNLTVDVAESATKDFKFSLNILDGVNLVKSGKGTQRINGLTMAGALTVSAGQMELYGDSSISGSVTLNGGVLEVSSTETSTITGGLTAAAGTLKVTGGKLKLDEFTGELTELTLGANANLEVNSGTLKGTTLHAANGGMLTLTMTQDGGNLDFTSLVLDADGKLSITLTGYDVWDQDGSKTTYQLFNSDHFRTLWDALDTQGKEWDDFFNIYVNGKNLRGLKLSETGQLSWTAVEPIVHNTSEWDSFLKSSDNAKGKTVIIQQTEVLYFPDPNVEGADVTVEADVVLMTDLSINNGFSDRTNPYVFNGKFSTAEDAESSDFKMVEGTIHGQHWKFTGDMSGWKGNFLITAGSGGNVLEFSGENFRSFTGNITLTTTNASTLLVDGVELKAGTVTAGALELKGVVTFSGSSVTISGETTVNDGASLTLGENTQMTWGSVKASEEETTYNKLTSLTLNNGSLLKLGGANPLSITTLTLNTNCDATLGVSGTVKLDIGSIVVSDGHTLTIDLTGLDWSGSTTYELFTGGNKNFTSLVQSGRLVFTGYDQEAFKLELNADGTLTLSSLAGEYVYEDTNELIWDTSTSTGTGWKDDKTFENKASVKFAAADGDHSVKVGGVVEALSLTIEGAATYNVTGKDDDATLSITNSFGSSAESSFVVGQNVTVSIQGYAGQGTLGLDGGTVELKDAAATVKKLDVTENGGTLKLASGSTTTFESVTGESGALTVDGTGNVTLKFANTGTLGSLTQKAETEGLTVNVELAESTTLKVKGASSIDGEVKFNPDATLTLGGAFTAKKGISGGEWNGSKTGSNYTILSEASETIDFTICEGMVGTEGVERRGETLLWGGLKLGDSSHRINLVKKGNYHQSIAQGDISISGDVNIQAGVLRLTLSNNAQIDGKVYGDGNLYLLDTTLTINGEGSDIASIRFSNDGKTNTLKLKNDIVVGEIGFCLYSNATAADPGSGSGTIENANASPENSIVYVLMSKVGDTGSATLDNFYAQYKMSSGVTIGSNVGIGVKVASSDTKTFTEGGAVTQAFKVTGGGTLELQGSTTAYSFGGFVLDGSKLKLSGSQQITLGSSFSWTEGASIDVSSTAGEGLGIDLSGVTSLSGKLTITLDKAFLDGLNAEDNSYKFFTWGKGYDFSGNFNVTVANDDGTYSNLTLTSDGTLTWGETEEPTLDTYTWRGETGSVTLGDSISGGKALGWDTDSGDVNKSKNVVLQRTGDTGTVDVTVSGGADNEVNVNSLTVGMVDDDSTTYTFQGNGQTLVVNGTLTLNDATTFEVTTEVQGALQGSADLTVKGDMTLDTALDGTSFTGGITLDGGTLNLTGDNTLGTDKKLTLGENGGTLNGSITAELSGENAEATLTLGKGNQNLSGSTEGVVDVGGTLTGDTLTVGGLTGSGTVGGSITVSGTGGTFEGTVAESLALTVQSGTQGFRNSVTLSSVTLSGGTLQLAAGGTVTQLTVDVGDSGTIEMGGDLSIGNFKAGDWPSGGGVTPAGEITIKQTSSGEETKDALTLTLTPTANQFAWTSDFTLGEKDARINLKKVGSKVQVIGAGTVTIHGDVEVEEGALRFTGATNSTIDGSLSGAGTLDLAGGTNLTITGANGSVGSIKTLQITMASSASPTLNLGGDLTFNSLTQISKGTLTLNRADVSGAPETVYLLWDSTGQDGPLSWATYTGKYAGVTFNDNTGYGIAGDLTISDDATMDKNFKVAAGSVTIEGQTTMQQKAVELGDEATLDLKGGVTGTLTKLTLGAGSTVHIGGEGKQTLGVSSGLTWGEDATLDIDSQLTINLTGAMLTKPTDGNLLTIDLSSEMLDELGSDVWQLFSGWGSATNWKDYFTFTIDGQTVNDAKYGNFGLDNGGKLTWEAPENPDLYWTGEASGETLTWGGEDTEWSTSSGEEPSVAWPDAGTAGVDVHVAGTEDAQYTVQMTEDVTANSVEFDGGDYTFQGGAGSTLATKGSLTVGKENKTTVDFGDKQLNVGGNMAIGDNSEETVGSTLEVGGNLTTGDSSKLTTKGATSVGGDLTLGSGSTATADGELDVAGDVNVGSGTLTANGGGTWGSAQLGSGGNLSMKDTKVKGALSVEGGNLTVGGEKSTLGSVSGTLTELEITEGGSLTVQGGNGLAADSFKWGADSTLSLGSDFTGTLDFGSMDGNSGDLTLDFSSEFLEKFKNGDQLFADVEGFGDGWNNFKFTVDGKDPSDSYGDLKVDESGCLTWTKSDTPSPEGDTYVSSKDNDPAKPTEWESGDKKNIYDSVGDYGQVIVDSNTNIDFSKANVADSNGREQWEDDGLTVHNLSGNNANATLTITGGGDNDMVTLKNTGKEKEMTYSGGITVKGAELHINHEDTSSGSLHQGAELGTVMKGELDLSDGLGLYMDRGVLELQNVKNELTDVTFTHGRDGQLIVNGGAATVSGNITVVAEGEAVYTEDKEGKPVTRNHVQLVGGGVLQLVGGDTEEEATTVGAGVAIGAGMGFLSVGGVVEVKGHVKMEEGSKLNNVLLMLDGEGTVLKVGAGPATAHSLAVEGDAVPTADGGGDAGPTLCGLIMNGGKITGKEDYEFQLNGGSFSTNGGDLSGYDGTMKFESGLFCQVFTRMKGGENWDVTMESGAQVLFDVVNESGMNEGWQMGDVYMKDGSHTTFVFTFNIATAGMKFKDFNLAKDADITFRVDSGSAPTSKKFVIGTYDSSADLNAVTVAAEAAEADEVAEASELETRVAASELDSATSRKLDRSQLVGGAWLHVKEATLKAEGDEIYLALTESDTNSLAEAVQGTHQNAVEGAKALWELTGFNPKAAEAINNPNSDTNKLRNEAQRLLSSGNNADLAKMLAAASGAAYTGYSAALGEDMHRQLTVIRNRTTSMGDEAAQAATDDDMPYWHAWVNAESSFRELDADGLAPGYRLNGWGGTLGVDADISRNTTVGLALTAMYNDLKCTGADSISGDMDTMYATAFVRYMSGRWMHTLVLSEGTADFKTHRTVMTGSGNYTADADTNGYALGALYELGYTTLLQKDARSVMQYVINAEVRYNKIDGFMESGSDAGLSVEDMDSTTLTFGAGARFQSLIGENVYNRSALFESRLLVKVDAGDRRGEAATRFINGSYVTNMVGAEVGVVGVEIGAGITIPLGGGLSGGSFFMDGSVEFRQGWTSFDATAGFRISF